MRREKRILSAVIASAIMLLLILDTQTAAAGAAEGIELCFKVVIPSLFPFFIVTTYLNASLLGMHIPGLSSLSSILNIPSGGESLLLLGLIGGYPVGAQLIADAYRQGRLEKRTGQILLGYCSNAGPAFIFGVAGALFSSLWPPLVLWTIHLLSAVVTGFLLPRPVKSTMSFSTGRNVSIVQALQKSISICASVCGWIVVFKIILAYFVLFAGGFLNSAYMLLLSGILELSNGCFQLGKISAESTRFILCSVFLAFGGVCVLLQTLSVTDGLGMGLYLPGKLMQSCISLFFALGAQFFLFPSDHTSVRAALYMMLLSVAALMGFKILAEKSCGNPKKNHV